MLKNGAGGGGGGGGWVLLSEGWHCGLLHTPCCLPVESSGITGQVVREQGLFASTPRIVARWGGRRGATHEPMEVWFVGVAEMGDVPTHLCVMPLAEGARAGRGVGGPPLLLVSW